ncbi:CRAL-TRIO domain-containing protein [Xylaria bambusicola]|uniref:CRAL-TRIO domain-containing protein n=1 Tax=Xylaria bambusicola TaxID=326684 RepID=UPI002007B907|nr:CRAL-TRIO domain-containing protein [Xylaria bambusicola]KAI0508676.1 CRAL-TRIO domain-containing protein [Xylaria bambusicola]
MSDLRRVPSSGAVDVGYPTGHLGHLTEHETQALADFKALLQEKGLYKPGPPSSHDDPTLLRYLRARKWVPQDAYVQFADTEKFRNANEIDTLYETIDIDSYEASRKLYPRFTGHRDKRGIPIYVFQIRHLDSKAVADYEKSTETTYSKAKTDGKTPAKLLRLFALYENLTRFAQPLSSECVDRQNPETPITLSTNIVDISHVSLRMFWNLKAHMQAASQLATAHYPETLDRIFIIGAPYFFSTVWGWIKRWFDPVTVSKIFILSDHDVLPVLTTFMDLEDIPKVYGGKLEWSFFDEPAYDDEIKRIVTWENGFTNFPPGPCYWRPSADGTRLECLAVGSKGGKERREVVCTIPKAFLPKSDSATETSTTNNEKEEVSEEASTETAPKAPLPRADDPEATTAESTADAVAGLVITDAKDSTEQLSEKIASVADALPETKAH